jgi:hypothetical protein
MESANLATIHACYTHENENENDANIHVFG